MYVIQRWNRWMPTLLAAYEVIDGHIIFDRSRGDKKFREGLETFGVPVIGDAGQTTDYVHPSDGVAFHEACFLVFSTKEVTIADEDSLKKLESFMHGRQPSNSTAPPPAGISAA
jgi:hypothetical protein